MMNHDQRATASRCSHELWEGVTCKLQAGHAGPHYAPASTSSGCALSWRSSTPPLRTVPRASPPHGVPLPRLPAWAFLASSNRS